MVSIFGSRWRSARPSRASPHPSAAVDASRQPSPHLHHAAVHSHARLPVGWTVSSGRATPRPGRSPPRPRRQLCACESQPRASESVTRVLGAALAGSQRARSCRKHLARFGCRALASQPFPRCPSPLPSTPWSATRPAAPGQVDELPALPCALRRCSHLPPERDALACPCDPFRLQ